MQIDASKNSSPLKSVGVKFFNQRPFQGEETILETLQFGYFLEQSIDRICGWFRFCFPLWFFGFGSFLLLMSFRDFLQLGDENIVDVLNVLPQLLRTVFPSSRSA